MPSLGVSLGVTIGFAVVKLLLLVVLPIALLGWLVSVVLGARTKQTPVP